MYKPRLSIRTMIFVVLVIAADCAVLRHALDDGIEQPGVQFGVLAVLPMVNILALGLYRGGGGLPFLIGFEAFGLLAVLLFAGCFILSPSDWISELDHVLVGFFKQYDSYNELLKHAGSSIFARTSLLAIGVTTLALLFGTPQFLIALSGGFLFRAIARRRGLATREAGRPP